MLKICFAGILSIALVFGIICAEACIGMLLFNWVMSLYNCTFVLTFRQAFSICCLFGFIIHLFKLALKK